MQHLGEALNTSSQQPVGREAVRTATSFAKAGMIIKDSSEEIEYESIGTVDEGLPCRS